MPMWETLSGEGLIFFLYLFTQISERLVEFGKTFIYLYQTRGSNEEAAKDWNSPRHEKIRTLWSFLASWIVGSAVAWLTHFYVVLNRVDLKDWPAFGQIILMGFVIATVSQPLHNALGRFAGEKKKHKPEDDSKKDDTKKN